MKGGNPVLTPDEYFNVVNQSVSNDWYLTMTPFELMREHSNTQHVKRTRIEPVPEPDHDKPAKPDSQPLKHVAMEEEVVEEVVNFNPKGVFLQPPKPVAMEEDEFNFNPDGVFTQQRNSTPDPWGFFREPHGRRNPTQKVAMKKKQPDSAPKTLGFHQHQPSSWRKTPPQRVDIEDGEEEDEKHNPTHPMRFFQAFGSFGGTSHKKRKTKKNNKRKTIKRKQKKHLKRRTRKA